MSRTPLRVAQRCHLPPTLTDNRDRRQLHTAERTLDLDGMLDASNDSLYR